MLPARPAVHVTNLVFACAGGDRVWDNGNGILSRKKFVLNVTNCVTA
jgi:hypothetical protein